MEVTVNASLLELLVENMSCAQTATNNHLFTRLQLVLVDAILLTNTFVGCTSTTCGRLAKPL